MTKRLLVSWAAIAVLTGCGMNVVGGGPVPNSQVATGVGDNPVAGSQPVSARRALALFDSACMVVDPPFDKVAQRLLSTGRFRAVTPQVTVGTSENVTFRHGKGPSGPRCTMSVASSASNASMAAQLRSKYGSAKQRSDGALLFQNGKLIYWSRSTGGSAQVFHTLHRS